MNILVVDDSSSIRRMLRHELEGQGNTVHEAESGDQALQMLESIVPDVISLDVDMPGISGFETCSLIRSGNAECVKKNPSLATVPIIFLTAHDTEEARYEGYRAGANGFVIKPFIKGELTNEIERSIKLHDDLRGHSVLLVDDSSTTRELLKRGLKEKGLTVIEAKNGAEGLEIIKNDPDAIDLTIIDNLMPEMNGDELCRRIRQDLGLKDLPIIFLSSICDKKFMINMFELGVSDFLIKPFIKEELQARVIVHLKAKVLGDRMLRKVVELKREHKHKDEFLSICSHDLRSPLTGVVGFTDIMLEDEETSEDHREFLTHIKSSSEFLLSIINDILDLGRLQSEAGDPDFKIAPIGETLESCLGTLRHMASPKNIELVMDNQLSPADQGEISADSNSIKRLYNNLVSNSIKFSHPYDKVTIRIERATGDIIKTSIIDQGIGIPADKLPHIFAGDGQTSQRGTQGEESFGFGMSIIKQIVDQHDGDVSIDSIQGKGTTVTVALPASQPLDISAN